MSLLTLDLGFCVGSIFMVMWLTDSLLNPERWMVGLKIVLPPQQVTTQNATNTDTIKQRSSEKISKEAKKKKTEFFFRFEKIRPGVPTQLYFYKEYDNLISIAFITALNYLFGLFWEHHTGKDSIYTTIWQLVFIILCCYSMINIGVLTNVRDSIEGVFSFWFSVISFLVSLTFMQTNSFATFNIDNAYQALKVHMDNNFFEPNLWNVRLPAEPLFFKFLLAICCGMLSYTIFFSVVKSIRCHWYYGNDLFRQQTKNNALTTWIGFGSYMNIIFPLVTVLLFLRPFVSIFPSDNVARSAQIWMVFLTAVTRMLYVRPYLQSYLFSVLTIGLESSTIAQKERGSERVDYLRIHLLTNLKYIMLVVLQLIIYPMILLTFVIILNNRAQDFRFVHPEITGNVSLVQPLLDFNLWSSYGRTHLQYFIAEVFTFLAFWGCLASTALNGLTLVYYDILERGNRKEQEKRLAERRHRRDSST